MGRHVFDVRVLSAKFLTLTVTFQKCKNNRVINFLLFNFWNNYLFVEIYNKEIFEFLAGSLIRVFKIFVEGCSMTNAKVYMGFHDDKKIEEHWSTFM